MLRNIAISIASLALAGTAFAAPVQCESTNYGVNNTSDFRYFIVNRTVSVRKNGSLVGNVQLNGAGGDSFFNGRKIYVYGTGKVSAGKMFLFSYYIDDTTVEAGVYLKHDGVDTFQTNCEF